MAAAADIAEDAYVRGNVSYYKEVWGSMIFNHKDLLEHDGKVNEKSFLRILPDAVDDFLDLMKMTVSINLLGGPSFATVTANGDASGNISVDRPDRFNIGQKVYFTNSTPATSAAGYVKTINVNTGALLVVTARGGSTGVDLSLQTVALASKAYHDGASTDSFTSLKSAMLSATNGGSSTLYGVSKVAYPFLQCINISGATITAANILDKIFDAYTTFRNLGKGNPNEAIMSYKHLGSIMKVLEVNKGAFNIKPESTNVSVYGWTEIELFGVKGSLKVIGVQEMDNDWIAFIDWRALKFHSNGFFRKRVSPDGENYFEVRGTTGYQYILDMCLFGELILNRPSYCGAIYAIPNY